MLFGHFIVAAANQGDCQAYIDVPNEIWNVVANDIIIGNKGADDIAREIEQLRVKFRQMMFPSIDRRATYHGRRFILFCDERRLCEVGGRSSCRWVKHGPILAISATE